MSTAVTIRDIARSLGLSKSTVHRCLNGDRSVSKETRTEVESAAKRMGYHRSPLYSMVSLHKARKRRNLVPIAYLMCSALSKWGARRAGNSRYEFVADASVGLGYEATVIDIDTFGAGPRIMDVLYHQGYAGAVVGPMRAPEHLGILHNQYLPVVCCGRLDILPLHTVQLDAVDGVRTAWHHLRARNYRRIGAWVGQHSPPLPDDWDRLGAVRACQDEMGDEGEKIPPFTGPLAKFEPDHITAWIRENRPDALLIFNLGCFERMKASRIDLRKLGVAALHTEPGPVAGIVEPQAEVAQRSVELLDQLIRHGEVGIPKRPLRILVPGEWNEGKTLAVRRDGIRRVID